MSEDESCSIPNLGHKRAVGIDQLIGDGDVRSRRAHAGQSEPHGICTVAVADLQRIDDIALGFGHFLAIGIANDSGDVHSFERNFVHELQAEHHHPRDPKEYDVVGGNEQRCRIKRLQIVRLVRPAQG